MPDERAMNSMVIDSHTHIFPPSVRENPSEIEATEAAFNLMFAHGKSRMVDPGTMLEDMDEAGVDMAVLCPFPWMTLERCAENNDYLLEVAAARPDRFLPFAVTNPGFGRSAVDEARRGLEAGARGLGELHVQPQGFDISDLRLMEPLVDLALQFDVPIMIHVNEPVGHIYPGKGPVTPGTIYGFIQSFPAVKLILPHWGGGLPFYELMPEVAEDCFRVFYDSAASPFLYRSDIYRLAAAAAGGHKILFATDYPLLPYGRTLADARAGMEDTALAEDILGRNAARLFSVDIQDGSAAD
jgi:predicted TIM-barrel fold metal-dependent hydrolase